MAQKRDSTEQAEKGHLWELAGSVSRPAPLGLAHFEKELVRVGTFTHPEKGFTVDVTPERMERWVKAFTAMRGHGVAVPVPYGHSTSARDNAGWLRDMWVEDGRLVGLIEVPKEDDADNLGTTVREVSVSIHPDLVDGEGRRYGEAIDHVALTNHPVVPGQENFRRVSLGGEPLEVIRLERIDSESEKKEEKMDPKEQDGKEIQGAAPPATAARRPSWSGRPGRRPTWSGRPPRAKSSSRRSGPRTAG